MTSTMFRRSALAGTVAMATAVAAAWGGSALAGPVADNAARAESLLATGDAAGAAAAFDAATDAFAAASPLQFRVALFADQVTGFGQYRPRADGPFRSGDTVTVYLEPVGYGFSTDGGEQRVSFSTGIEIRTPGGLVLGKTDDFGKVEWQGQSKDRSIDTAVSVALPQLKPGSYELLLTLTDAATAKSATATLPFTIAE
jgi:hypothetical protein